ncbi:MAG: T9SS type A sorting domain-containing protein [Bacteroidales bacterium]|nr:T9SS type A sorting domain-containing protein [Bacteroidales bacterium]
MKKLFLGCLLALGFGCGVQAQGVDVYVNGTLMTDGSSLTIKRATVDKNNLLHAYTIFHNTGDAAVTLTGKKVATLPEDVHDGWCIWETCMAVNEIEAERKLEAGKRFEGPTEFLDIQPKGYVGEDISITYTFSTVEHPEQTTTFTLNWILGEPTLAPVKMTVDGQEVEQDKFIKVERETQATGMLHVEMTFDNTGSEAVKMAADRTKVLVEGTTTDWCMFGSCFPSDNITGMDPLAPGLTESSGDAPQYLEYTPNGTVGESLVYYSIYTADDEFNRTDFVVRWVTKEAEGGGSGTANENAADAVKTAVYPNPAVTAARLTWEAVEGAVVLNVRSVSGQLVYSLPVEGLTETEINVAGFTPGMYFYTLERQGERLAGGKLLVR